MRKHASGLRSRTEKNARNELQQRCLKASVGSNAARMEGIANDRDTTSQATSRQGHPVRAASNRVSLQLTKPTTYTRRQSSSEVGTWNSTDGCSGKKPSW